MADLPVPPENYNPTRYANMQEDVLIRADALIAKAKGEVLPDDYKPFRLANYNLDVLYRLEQLYKVIGTGGGDGGTSIHNELSGRDAIDCHPIESITDLVEVLNLLKLSLESKVETVNEIGVVEGTKNIYLNSGDIDYLEREEIDNVPSLPGNPIILSNENTLEMMDKGYFVANEDNTFYKKYKFDNPEFPALFNCIGYLSSVPEHYASVVDKYVQNGTIREVVAQPMWECVVEIENYSMKALLLAIEESSGEQGWSLFVRAVAGDANVDLMQPTSMTLNPKTVVGESIAIFGVLPKIYSVEDAITELYSLIKNTQTQGVLYVNQNSKSDIEDGSLESPYKTIQGALDNSPGSSEIYVFGGVYTENIRYYGNNRLIGDEYVFGYGLDRPSSVTLNGIIEAVNSGSTLDIIGMRIDTSISDQPKELMFRHCELNLISSVINNSVILIDSSFLEINANSFKILEGQLEIRDSEFSASILSPGLVIDGGHVLINGVKNFRTLHNGGNLTILGDTTVKCIVYEHGTYRGLESTAAKGQGYLHLISGRCCVGAVPYGGNTMGIKKTGDCDYGIMNFIYNPLETTLNGDVDFTNLNYQGLLSNQLFDFNTRDGYTIGDDKSLKGHLDAIANKLKDQTGGSPHTIVNKSGNAVPQRGNLQFKNLDVVDNEDGDTTEIAYNLPLENRLIYEDASSIANQRILLVEGVSKVSEILNVPLQVVAASDISMYAGDRIYLSVNQSSPVILTLDRDFFVKEGMRYFLHWKSGKPPIIQPLTYELHPYMTVPAASSMAPPDRYYTLYTAIDTAGVYSLSINQSANSYFGKKWDWIFENTSSEDVTVVIPDHVNTGMERTVTLSASSILWLRIVSFAKNRFICKYEIM